MDEGDGGGSELPAAGWYDDPAGGPGVRYWDGAAWADQQPLIAPAKSGIGTGKSTGKVILIVLGISLGVALLLFGICLALIRGSGY